MRLILAGAGEEDASRILMELERNGFVVECERVVTAGQFAAALARLPDAVIAVDNVPGLDIKDVLAAASAAMPDVPVIAVSDSASADLGVELMRLGAEDYLSKAGLERLGLSLQRGLDRGAERGRLRSAETDYQQLFDQLPVGVARNLVSGLTVQVNQALMEILRYPDQPTYFAEVSDTAIEFMSVEAREMIASRLAQSGVARGIEVQVKRYDGSWGWVRLDLRISPGLRGEMARVDTVVTDIDDRKRAEAALERTAENLRKSDAVRQLLLDRLISAQEEERRKIALDIHDDAVQVMTAASIRLVLLGQKINDDLLNTEVERLVDTVTESTVRLRRLMFDLQPPALERHGLAAALRMALEMLSADAAIGHTMIGELDEEPCRGSGVVAYRIFQEALANVRRHSGASHVTVTVANRGEDVCVSIVDDGRGFDQLDPVVEEKVVHLGLASMRERAYLAGGRWSIVSAPKSGTRVDFAVPLTPRAPARHIQAVA